MYSLDILIVNYSPPRERPVSIYDFLLTGIFLPTFYIKLKVCFLNNFSEGRSLLTKRSPMEPIDCKDKPYCYECNYRYNQYHNAFNDPDLSLTAKVLWALISERESGFDASEYLDDLCEEDLLYGAFMELARKGYFDRSYLECGMGGG